MNKWIIGVIAILTISVILGIKFFSEESQNKTMRYFQSSVGYKYGTVLILAGHQKPVMQWLRVEKLTSAEASQGSSGRNYRYGFGYFDENMNNSLDASEEANGKEYFEVGPYNMYIFRDAKRDPIKGK